MNNERARSVTRRRGGRVHHGVRPERSRAGGVAPTRELWAERTGRAQPPPAGERLAPRDATRRRRSASRPSGLDSLPSLPPPRSLSLSLSHACLTLSVFVRFANALPLGPLPAGSGGGWGIPAPKKTAPKTGFLHEPLQQNRPRQHCRNVGVRMNISTSRERGSFFSTTRLQAGKRGGGGGGGGEGS